jgi:hypothetical protein
MDFTDNTDQERLAQNSSFTRWVKENAPAAFDKNPAHPCHPHNPWFLNYRFSVHRGARCFSIMRNRPGNHVT